MSETRKLFESFKNNLNEAAKKVDASKLKNELEAELKKFMTESKRGFDAEKNPEDKWNTYYGDYCGVEDIETDEDGDYIIHVYAEVSYDSLAELAERLNKIITKYDKDAYFEAECSGRLVSLMHRNTVEIINESTLNEEITVNDPKVILAKIFARYPDIDEEDEDYLNGLSYEELVAEVKNRGWNDVLDESVLNEDDSFYNELEVTKYRPTGQDEGILANMTIKSKFGELEVNLYYLDGEYQLATPNMWRTTEQNELIDNLVNEYTMQGLIDFAADYYKKSHMNESALNENERTYKKGDIVYWIGAGNEISAEGQIIDFPDKERMTIKWDDGEVNTYSIGHPDIEHADDYTELEPDLNESTKLKEEENPTSIDDILAKLSEYMDNAGFSIQQVLKELSNYGVNDSIFSAILKDYEEYLNENNKGE